MPDPLLSSDAISKTYLNPDTGVVYVMFTADGTTEIALNVPQYVSQRDTPEEAKRNGLPGYSAAEVASLYYDTNHNGYMDKGDIYLVSRRGKLSEIGTEANYDYYVYDFATQAFDPKPVTSHLDPFDAHMALDRHGGDLGALHSQ